MCLISADILSIWVYILHQTVEMSSVIFYAFPSFYCKEGWNKFVASSSHPTCKLARLNRYLRNVCRAWLQNQGGRMGVLGHTWWKEGGRAGCSRFQPFSPSGRLFWKGGRCHPTAAGNHTSRRGLTTALPALLLQGCLPEGVNTLSLLPAAQIPWHTCLPPPKGLGVGRGTHSKLLFLPTSEGL